MLGAHWIFELDLEKYAIGNISWKSPYHFIKPTIDAFIKNTIISHIWGPFDETHKKMAAIL